MGIKQSLVTRSRQNPLDLGAQIFVFQTDIIKRGTRRPLMY